MVRTLVVGGMLAGVHDVGTGGLGLALAEMAVRSGVGFHAARIHDAAELFSESPSRVVLCVAPDLLQPVLNVCERPECPQPASAWPAATGCRSRGCSTLTWPRPPPPGAIACRRRSAPAPPRADPARLDVPDAAAGCRAPTSETRGTSR